MTRVLTVARVENAHPLTAGLAPQIDQAAAGYSHMFAPSTTFGKDVAPRVAALLGVAQVSDVMSVEGAHTFKRPIYAGNAIITVEADATHTVVATIRTASWPAAASGAHSALIEALRIDVALPSHTRFVELKQGSSDRPELQSASKVVSGGRGVGSKENFDIIYAFADKIGAAVGASRAAVDAGYVPNELQVGQPARSSRPSCTWPSAPPAPSSTLPASRTLVPSWRSTRTARRRSSKSPISGWWGICSRSFRSWSRCSDVLPRRHHESELLQSL